ncbi:MAG: hypothetical protein CVV49_15420 [Spirochaetae bacterium HGW-Spirochaetae-5]|nr:MAG: hypothetical protein CVV49_15420 [Spirochaetae bacterium HGW-Spirochaetae-5]
MKEFITIINAAVLLYAAASFFLILKKTKTAFILLVTGFILYSFFLISRGWITGVFIPNGMTEGVFFMPWSMTLLIIGLSVVSSDSDFRREILTGIIPVLCFSIFALFYPKGIIPPTPNKMTIWAYIFFITEASGHACFYLGSWYAASSAFRKKRTVDFHKILVWGFILFSVSQVSGAVWAFLGWGSPFRWGTRHLQSAVIWCYYAAYLHIRFLKGWSDLRKTVYAVAGSIVVGFCSFGSYLHEMNFPRIGG